MGRKTAKDCYRHAIKRARERYDAFFTFDEMEVLSRRIRQCNVPGRAGVVHLLTESGTRTHWLIDDQFIVVYNRNLKAITTFLPPDAIYSYLPVRQGFRHDVLA